MTPKIPVLNRFPIDFEKNYREHFIREKDIRKIAQLGFNCIRVPFHYRLIEKKPFQYEEKGLRFLDKLIQWGQKYKVWIILDLHAAAGSQNRDWHPCCTGRSVPCQRNGVHQALSLTR